MKITKIIFMVVALAFVSMCGAYAADLPQADTQDMQLFDASDPPVLIDTPNELAGGLARIDIIPDSQPCAGSYNNASMSVKALQADFKHRYPVFEVGWQF